MILRGATSSRRAAELVAPRRAAEKMQIKPLGVMSGRTLLVENFVMLDEAPLRGFDDLTEVLTSLGWLPISAIGPGHLLCEVAPENIGEDGRGAGAPYTISFAHPSDVFHRAGHPEMKMVKLASAGDTGIDLLVAPNQKTICVAPNQKTIRTLVSSFAYPEFAIEATNLAAHDGRQVLAMPRLAALPLGSRLDDLNIGLKFYIAAKIVAAPIAMGGGAREVRSSLGLSEDDPRILHHCSAADTSFFDALCREMGVPHTDAGPVSVVAIHPALLERPVVDFADANRRWAEDILGYANLWLSQIGCVARRDELSSMALVQDDGLRAILSAAATMAGRYNRDIRSKLIISRKSESLDARQTHTPLSWRMLDEVGSEVVQYGGAVHGLTVPSGRIVVRRNGAIAICADSRD